MRSCCKRIGGSKICVSSLRGSQSDRSVEKDLELRNGETSRARLLVRASNKRDVKSVDPAQAKSSTRRGAMLSDTRNRRDDASPNQGDQWP